MRTTLLLLSACFAACSPLTEGDLFVTRPDEVTTTTDAGTPCTPRREQASWPVRVVFVVQNSGAMCIVDPPGSQPGGSFCEMYAGGLPNPGGTMPARVSVISRFFTANAARPNVSAAVVTYGSNPKVIGFQPTNQPPPSELNNFQAQLTRTSNLQGALEAAKSLIEQDVQATAASVRARSRYVVVVLSTGIPFPRCSANDGLAQYASASQPQLVWADSSGAANFCNAVTPGDPDNVDGFSAGSDLNQNAQLFAAVDGMLGLDAQYGLGDVRVFTRLLMNDANVAACGPICQDLFGRQSFADTRAMGTWLLGQLAQRGQGTFVDPGAPQQLTLADIDTSEFTTFCGP